MEHDNIDQIIKEHFANKSIQPSLQAREHLIKALNSKTKKKKSTWLRLGIAASLILAFAFLTQLLFFSNAETESLRQVTSEKALPKIMDDVILQKIPENSEENGHVIVNSKTEAFDNKESILTNRFKSDLDSQMSTTKIELITRTKFNHFLDQTEISNLSKPSAEDTNFIAAPSKVIFVTSENLMAFAVADSSIQIFQFEDKSPKAYADPNRLLIEIEKQLFDEKNKAIVNKAGRQLKKIKEALADRNYKN